MLTILTYAMFTGLSYFAQTWWQLLIFRFLAALGIGGEWAVGAALLSETWPRKWRPWLAAVLQTAVNLGILVASLTYLLMSHLEYRYVFLVGIAPALVTLWIRRAVPETEQWHAAKAAQGSAVPGIADLFVGDVRRTTILTILVCACRSRDIGHSISGRCNICAICPMWRPGPMPSGISSSATP